MSAAALSKNQWGFSPQTITGCQLWLDGADTTSMAFSGSSVTTWNDKSGNVYNATSAGTSITTSSTGLVFGGSSYMTISSGFAGKLTNTPFVVFAVEKFTGNFASKSWFFGDDANTGVTDSTLTLGYRQSVSAANGHNGAYSMSFWVDDLDNLNFNQSSSTSVVRLWTNYLPLATNRNVRLNGLVDATHSNFTRLNAFATPVIGRANGLGYYYGTMSELIVYNTDIGLSAIQQVEGYLAAKWGLQSSLPPTHPYSTLPAKAFPGLQLWLDARDPSGAGNVPPGTTVTTWTDKSGRGNNATSAGTAVTTAATGLSFGGSSYFTVAGLSGSIANTPFVIFAVETLTGTANNYLFGEDSTTHLATDQALHIGYRTQTDLTMAFYGDDLEDTAVSGSGSTRILVFYLPTASNRNIRRNGSVDATRANFTRLGQFTNPVIGRVFAGNYYSGSISEIIVYNQDIGLPAIQLIEKYLATKWNVTLSATGDISQLTKPVYARPFQPVDILGCSLWLDGADPTTITLNGSTVSSWADKSGAARTVTQATAGLQPTYSSTSNALIFNQSSYLNIPDALNSILPTYTIFVVEKRSSANVMFFIGEHDVAVTNTALVLGYNATNVSRHTTIYIVDCDVTIPSYAGASEPIRINRYDYSGTTRDTVINGGQYSTFQSFSSTLPSWSNPNIGAGFSSSTYWYIGNIYEVIFYNTVLTNTQAQQVESYLAWKWGLRTNLPSTHPGYTLPSYSPKFTPKSISGMSLWLDAADPTTLTMSGTTVVSWVDKSGNGYSFTKASYSGGTISLSSQNGNPTVNLNSQVMTTSSFPWTTWTTMFFVVSTNAWIYTLGTVSLLDYFYTGNWYLLANGQNFEDANVAQGTDILSSLSLQNKYCLLTIGYGGGTQANNYTVNGTVRYTTSGTSAGNGTITAGSVLSQSTTTSSLWLNGSYAFNYGSTTYAAEIVHYNTPLTTSQRQQVEGYLAWKWGIASSLPSTHPFAKISP